jgi:hypothetical protein
MQWQGAGEATKAATMLAARAAGDELGATVKAAAFDDADEMARGILRLSELLLVRLATLSGGTGIVTKGVDLNGQAGTATITAAVLVGQRQPDAEGPRPQARPSTQSSGQFWHSGHLVRSCAAVSPSGDSQKAPQSGGLPLPMIRTRQHRRWRSRGRKRRGRTHGSHRPALTSPSCQGAEMSQRPR